MQPWATLPPFIPLLRTFGPHHWQKVKGEYLLSSDKFYIWTNCSTWARSKYGPSLCLISKRKSQLLNISTVWVFWSIQKFHIWNKKSAHLAIKEVERINIHCTREKPGAMLTLSPSPASAESRKGPGSRDERVSIKFCPPLGWYSVLKFCNIWITVKHSGSGIKDERVLVGFLSNFAHPQGWDLVLKFGNIWIKVKHKWSF